MDQGGDGETATKATGRKRAKTAEEKAAAKVSDEDMWQDLILTWEGCHCRRRRRRSRQTRRRLSRTRRSRTKTLLQRGRRTWRRC